MCLIIKCQNLSIIQYHEKLGLWSQGDLGEHTTWGHPGQIVGNFAFFLAKYKLEKRKKLPGTWEFGNNGFVCWWSSDVLGSSMFSRTLTSGQIREEMKRESCYKVNKIQATKDSGDVFYRQTTSRVCSCLRTVDKRQLPTRSLRLGCLQSSTRGLDRWGTQSCNLSKSGLIRRQGGWCQKLFLQKILPQKLLIML